MIERTSFADRLYAMLPVVYRDRDRERDEDLRAYLGACGDLLDALRQGILQRYADMFPDAPDDDLACQDWILPYLADLLAVRLVSPDAEGRREEVDNAIDWRQRKGTPAVVERVTESVGRFEAELWEGWQRIAVTARIDAVRLSARAYGVEPPTDALDVLAWRTPASIAARHPTLVAGTVDLRCRAGAVRADETNRAARTTTFRGERVTWRQASAHGAPCRPGAFDDPSRRTVDTRTPRWDRGHFHSRRLLIYLPPSPGLCEDPELTVDWADRGTPAFEDAVSVTRTTETIDIRPADSASGPVRVTGDIEISGLDATIEDLVLEGALAVDSATLELSRCAVASVEVASGSGKGPALVARDSLLVDVVATDLTARFEYATVLGRASCREVLASDSIFLAPVDNDGGSLEAGCFRFSRIDAQQGTQNASTHRTTTALPVFFTESFCQWGCAVLHPASPQAILAGAEDGAEMGAHHHRGHALRAAAVLDKLVDFLPLGVEPVLIPDPALNEVPPEVN